MQPWKVSLGMTVAIAGVAAILLADRLAWLAPYRRVILADYGMTIGLYVALGLATIAALLYWAARALGLGDLGKKVDLVERSVRRGEGDRELAAALERDAEGKWE